MKKKNMRQFQKVRIELELLLDNQKKTCEEIFDEIHQAIWEINEVKSMEVLGENVENES